ncbi:MAG: hypothetical protein M1825_001221 [Sarcosagium campestre]|nr:MAG: hypothetical protein M1825_001221 [Sarcosagium campestre]
MPPPLTRLIPHICKSNSPLHHYTYTYISCLGSSGTGRNGGPQIRHRSTVSNGDHQTTPHRGYYQLLLDQAGTSHSSRGSTATAATNINTVPPPPPPASPESKARVVFGSRLAGPAERRAELASQSINVAGVLVPPRPLEPDNCCMSGCVNCVWDRYRDEIEEWAARSAEARTRLTRQRQAGQTSGMMGVDEGTPAHVATSMDDDGGGSEAMWASALAPENLDGAGAAAVPSAAADDLFEGIPVGIREFMRTEKRLKEMHARADRAASMPA